jgi:hypothetical protein
MTVAPAPLARTHAPENHSACRGVPSDQTPLPGLVPAEEAAQNQMPTASSSATPNYHPSNLGSTAGGDNERETAAVVWRALAPHITRSPHMRLRTYSRTLRRHIYPTDQRLTAELPNRPAALRLYTDGGVAWCLGLDFDAKGHSAAAVADHANAAATFFTHHGARVIVDVAASGGRHVLIPLATPITLHQAQIITRACRALWPSLDITPMSNTAEGCLTAPGSRCRDGRYRTLLTPLHEAVDAVTQRSHPDLIDNALNHLIHLAGPTDTDPDDDPIADDTTAVSGGVRPLSPVHTIIAELGIWPSDRTTPHGKAWTRSEACEAVLCAAAARGYSATDLLTRINSGQWAGLLNLYTGRRGPRWRRTFKTEWAKAVRFVQASTDSPQEQKITGGHLSALTERDYIRRWTTIAMSVVDQLVPGKTRHSAKALLWGLGWLAWRTSRRHVEAGTRSYARATAGMLDHTTAAEILRQLRDLDASQRLLQLISAGRGTHGDLYELTIPEAYAQLATNPAEWVEPRPIPGVFGVRDPQRPRRQRLGPSAWRLHQALTAGTVGTATELARAAGVSRSEAYAVLPKLARLGLAATAPGTASGSRWQAGDRTTRDAGGEVDAPAHLANLDARYRSERQQWRAVLAACAERRSLSVDHVPDPGEPLWWPPDWAEHDPAPHSAAAQDDGPEAAALALLTEAFGALIVPENGEPIVPRPRERWLRRRSHTTTGHGPPIISS